MITEEQIKEIKKIFSENKVKEDNISEILRACYSLKETEFEEKIINNSELKIFNELLCEYSLGQLEYLCKGILLNIDITTFSHPKISTGSMDDALYAECRKQAGIE